MINDPKHVPGIMSPLPIQMHKSQHVSLVQYMVYHYPEGLEGWRLYRIEYGGHAEDCITEGTIWLPPTVDSVLIEQILREKISS